MGTYLAIVPALGALLTTVFSFYRRSSRFRRAERVSALVKQIEEWRGSSLAQGDADKHLNAAVEETFYRALFWELKESNIKLAYVTLVFLSNFLVWFMCVGLLFIMAHAKLEETSASGYEQTYMYSLLALLAIAYWIVFFWALPWHSRLVDERAYDAIRKNVAQASKKRFPSSNELRAKAPVEDSSGSDTSGD